MLTTKKRGPTLPAVGVALLIALVLGGCMPRGPRALLDGEQLIREGKFAAAVERLKVATTELPLNAQAWNHLGLACHGAGDGPGALAAYLTALRLDRDLYVVRYNLACLHLDNNDPAQAIDEFRSYLMRTNSLPALLKLGTAQLRAKRLDEAERSFRTVLSSTPANAEALNQMGVLSLLRMRPRDSAQWFTAALQQKPDYLPAMLNLAVVQQQYLGAPQAALEGYRSYLKVRPLPTNWASVSEVVSRLEVELGGAAPVRPTNVVSLPPSAASPATPTGTTPPRPPTNQVSSIRTGPPPAKTNLLIAAAPPSARTPDAPSTQPRPQTPPRRTSEEPAKVPAKTPTVDKPPAPEPAKPPVQPRVETGVTNPPPAVALMAKAEPAPRRTEKPGRIPSELVLSRYLYKNPPKPPPGDRSAATEAFSQGVEAQEQRRFGDAAAAFRKAAELDPAYFEAYYNWGWAAYQVGELRDALYAFEYALAVDPDSAGTRHSFSMALKRANYPQDAAIQLEKLLAKNPSDVRAHFALGNLYASELALPTLAREHYLRLLELDPKHPKAAEIRSWVATHP